MRRRQVVATLGLLATGSAGCSNTPKPTFSPQTGTPPPETDGGSLTPRPGFEVTTFATRGGEDENLVVDMTVSNPTERVQIGSVRVTAIVGETERSATQPLDLDPGAQRDLSVTVPVAYTEWEDGNGSLDFTFEYD